MSVAVAHHVTPTGGAVLRLGVKEAALRSTDLVVIHVVESLDQDIAEATRAGISDAVDKARAEAQVDHLDWDLRLLAGGSDIADVSSSILDEVKKVGPEVLVIGARRRSPVGKAFLGSVTQTIILEADLPVFVVKASD